MNKLEYLKYIPTTSEKNLTWRKYFLTYPNVPPLMTNM
jgi:hypothetical protein